MDLEEIDTPRDWPEHVRDFLTLEQLLRCEICFKFFTNCMMTSCSHNFCSLCIRKHLSYKPCCPICFKETIEPALSSNRLIDEVVLAFHNTRSKLIKMFKESTLEQDVKQSSHRNTLTNKSKDNVDCESDIMSPHLEANPKKVKSPAKLKTKSLPKRPYLPKRVYSLMKEKEIRDCLKQAGLKTKGKREDMVRRYKRYVILHNAECDSENPRPVSELVKEVEEEETLMQSLKTNSQKSFTTNHRSNPDEIEKERKQYVQSHASEYEKLIVEIKNRDLGKSALEPEVIILPLPSTSKQEICIEISSDSSDSESNAADNPCELRMDAFSTPGEITMLENLDETLILNPCHTSPQLTLAARETSTEVVSKADISPIRPVIKKENVNASTPNCNKRLILENDDVQIGANHSVDLPSDSQDAPEQPLKKKRSPLTKLKAIATESSGRRMSLRKRKSLSINPEIKEN